MTAKIFATIKGVELTERELRTLQYIAQFVKADPLHRPPTYQNVLDHLNTVLTTKLVSTQQVQRTVESLRVKGLLIDPAKLAEPLKASMVKTRNLGLTAKGKEVVLAAKI